MAENSGDRVVAIEQADSDTVYIFGYGTYVGDELPPRGISLLPDVPNPKIRLDDGSIVWGCQCWWGRIASEAEWEREYLEGRELVVVPAPEQEANDA